MNISESTTIQILHPQPMHITELRTLWKEAFGDTDAFLDTFFSTAFAPERCLCILMEHSVAAALYWFECEYQKKPLAYIYAVATAKACRGMGLCRQLLAATHATLRQQGYIGALLVPGSKTLFDFYKKNGYKTTCYRHIENYSLYTHINTSCSTNQISDTVTRDTGMFMIRQISASEYASLRKEFLPQESVLQEKENLLFLQTQLHFYSGENFLAAITITDQTLYCPELLYTECSDTTIFTSEHPTQTNPSKHIMNRLLSYFDCTNGIFCSPGDSFPFAMYYPLDDSIQKAPNYFAFAFD